MGTMDSNGFKKYVYAIPKKDPCPLDKRVSFPEEHPLSPEKILSEILADLQTLHATNNDYEIRKWMTKMLPLIDLLQDLKQASTSETPDKRKVWLEKTIKNIQQRSSNSASQPANPALKTLINKVKGS